MNVQKKQQKLLLSFFYPTLRVKKVKKLINKIRIKQPKSIFKFQSKNQKFLSFNSLIPHSKIRRPNMGAIVDRIRS